MSEQWYYRMFDEEFGPMPFEELKQLAEFGTISALDEVRAAGTTEWIAAASVEGLGLQADQGSVATCETPTSDADLPATKRSTDDWFCKLGDQELGPLTFEEIIEYVEREQLSADDEVKLGEQGKWRRVGSIGRLVAVIPYKAIEKNIVPSAPKRPTPPEELPVIDPEDLSELAFEVDVPFEESRSAAPVEDSQAAYQVAYEEAKAKIAQSMIAQAEATFKAAEEQAKAQIAWASAPNADRHWWGWAGGVEFGPVEFTQVFGLAKSGQLKPNDLIRNGQFGQFGPSANVPGLFNAVSMIARAAEALTLAKSQAQAAVALATPGDMPKTAPMATAPARSRPAPPLKIPPPPPKSDPVIPAPTARRAPLSDPEVPAPERPRRVEPVEAPRPTPPPEPRPTPYSSPMASLSSSGARPVVPVKKPTPIKSSGPSMFAGLIDQLKEPKAIGSVCAIALVLLIVGWGYLPKSKAADIKRYQALKGILDELKSTENNPSARATLATKATKIGKEITEQVKKQAGRDDPAKQCLLWAARDELPRVFGGTPPEGQAAAERNFASRIQEAAVELGLEARPKIAATVQAAPLPDD